MNKGTQVFYFKGHLIDIKSAEQKSVSELSKHLVTTQHV